MVSHFTKTMVGVIIAVCVIAIIVLFVQLNKSNKEVEHLKLNRIETLQVNEQIRHTNEELQRSVDARKRSIEALDLEKKSKMEEFDLWLKQTNDSKLEIEAASKLRAQSAYDESIEQLRVEYQSIAADMVHDVQHYNKDIEDLKKEIQNNLSLVNDLKEKQLAYIRAQLREEEKSNNIDFYRLAISETDIPEISYLREIQKRIHHKEVLDKFIWEVYYKPAYDTLMSNLALAQKEICGIYKITSIKTGKAYIGQSVNIKERFRQHIKAGLSSEPSSNKLYQKMQNNGVENFTFEILEQVDRNKLNERETYWIDFYAVKETGLNSTVGGS